MYIIKLNHTHTCIHQLFAHVKSYDMIASKVVIDTNLPEYQCNLVVGGKLSSDVRDILWKNYNHGSLKESYL